MSPLVPLVAIGALFALGRRGGSAGSMNSMDSMAHSKFSRLHELTGEAAWDVGKRPLPDVVQEFQVVMGTSRQDGVFDGETNSALDAALHALG